MVYVIKNKIISFGASSTVRDEQGADKFFVKGKIFTFTKKKFIMDETKSKTFYRVRNKFFHLLLPKVFIEDAEGNKLAMLKKKSLFSLKQNVICVPMNESGLDFSIDGDYISRNCTILKNGEPIAKLRRNFNLIKDSFMLDVFDDENAPLAIAIVIAFDNYYDKLLNQDR